MTSAVSEPGDGRPDRGQRPGRGAGGFVCGADHGGQPGSLDETARRLSHQELAAAEALVRDGHRVVSLPERRDGGRQADLLACGEKVEVKSFALPGEGRAGRPSALSVLNKLRDAAGQAPHVVINGRGSGLTADVVRRGVARYAGDRRAGPQLRSVRAIGDGFDQSWSLQARERRLGPPRPPGRPDESLGPPGLGL
jgi:hypothetical protein